ncbi:hypothetical protein BT96DRAFT_1004487 [Gymnopus androsaceus JB14]|uniref:Uncharacterized protein n=1 Tax=Gymnopus androsaceus JB14 TaxID=1447944 RepID=A0A6A4GSK6_9AGAR|nr:hypothetical protein BT96DRAFT_1004487 [Gymnopus androsaceus JB14]
MGRTKLTRSKSAYAKARLFEVSVLSPPLPIHAPPVRGSSPPFPIRAIVTGRKADNIDVGVSKPAFCLL